MPRRTHIQNASSAGKSQITGELATLVCTNPIKSSQNSDAVVKLGLCLTILAWSLDITDSDIPFVGITPNSCPCAFPSTGCFVRKRSGFLHGVHCFGSCKTLCEKSKRKTVQDAASQALFLEQYNCIATKLYKAFPWKSKDYALNGSERTIF